MNPLLILAGVGAGLYFYSKRSPEDTTVPEGAGRTLSTAEVAQITPVQQKVTELVASGQLVTEVKEIVTASGQTATVIIAPTPETPNRAVVVDPDDLTRIQGKYIPKVNMTPELQWQMSYAGYSNFNDFVSQLIAGRLFMFGPTAQTIRFPLADWEYWRTVSPRPEGGGPPALTAADVDAQTWSTPLNQEEYFALRDRRGLYPASLRGLGASAANWSAWQ